MVIPKPLWGHLIGGFGKLASAEQKLELTTGVPGTNVNLHSIGQLIEDITSGDFGKIKTFARSQLNSSSIKFLKDNADALRRLSSNNIDVGRSVADYTNAYPNLLKPGVADAYSRGGTKSVAAYLTKETGETFEKNFHQEEFHVVHAGMRIVQTFKDASDHFVAQGIKRDEADALAAEVVRKWHGLIGNVGRSQATKDGLSAAFYAPPFRESIVNMLWNSLKSVTTEFGNPAYYKNRRFLGRRWSHVRPLQCDQ